MFEFGKHYTFTLEAGTWMLTVEALIVPNARPVITIAWGTDEITADEKVVKLGELMSVACVATLPEKL